MLGPQANDLLLTLAKMSKQRCVESLVYSVWHLAFWGHVKSHLETTIIYMYIHIHTIPYPTLPYHTIPLHYITLHYITLHYMTWHDMTLHYITLHTYSVYSVYSVYIYTIYHMYILCRHTQLVVVLPSAISEWSFLSSVVATGEPELLGWSWMCIAVAKVCSLVHDDCSMYRL